MMRATVLLGFTSPATKLTGVTAVNRPAEFMAGRMLIEKSLKGEVTANPAKLADEDMKPKEWLA